ncbi:uncharacterized protein LOC132264676 [Phlebotomus argentipes]|uniref:uncharacterized protein LOC132264676 n=1 Tax=Phlebotomus argentipes TaxID=94469 RepID=UPI0028934C05|nr:uncharacterized protein LOC132264676 [Phlebotomus argentipes]
MSKVESTNSEVTRPDWLNEEFFAEIYAKDARFGGKKITFKILGCSSVVEIGDNYTSTMYRVKVEATPESEEPETNNFIVKAMIHTVPMLKEFSVFPIEIEAYEQVLPVMESYWREIGEDITFGPKCLHTISDPNEIIVLSDLRDEGFVMGNRFEGLDLQHAKLLLSKLAKFHATSVVFKERNGAFGPRLGRDVFDPKMKKMFDQFINGTFPTLLKFIESSEDLKKYYHIIDGWKEFMFERILKVSIVPKETDEFCSLNHADMWINNHMYKYDENNCPVDVLFIDFQMTHWGRPAVDLMYFLTSSVQPEIFVAEFDALIQHYHTNLVDALKRLGSQKTPPMLKDIQLQVLQNSFYACMCITGIVAIVLMDKNENATIENFMGESEGGDIMRQKMYFNPRYEHKLRLILPFLEKRGMLDADFVPESEIIAVEPDAPAPASAEVSENGTAPEEPSRDSLEKAIKEDDKQKEDTIVANGVHANGLEAIPDDKIAQTPKDVKEVNASNDKENDENESEDVEALKARQIMSPNDTSQKEEKPKSGNPKWLNKFFFNDILRKEFESFKVIRVGIAPATGKGENYASVMYRVKLQVENKEKHVVQRNYIVKALPDLGVSQDMIKQFNVFPKEIEMYDNILPAFEKMYEDVGVKIRFGPSCLMAGSEPTDVIVMEDMSEKSYKMANRKVGLDLDHCELLLDKLAKFHAASVVYREKNGPYKECFKNGIYSENMRPMFKQFFEANAKLFMEVSEEWGLTPKFRQLMTTWESGLMERCFEIVKEDPNFFNCLNHGDIWCNNSMFKYDSSGKVKDCILVDYQMCHYASPAIDLNYFIFTSLQKDIRLAKMDHLVQYYHTQLVSAMKLLKSTTTPPTLLDLQIEMLRKMHYGVSSTIGTFAICVADGSDESEMETFTRTDEKATDFKRKVYTNPIFVDALKQLVPFFDAKGLLD